MPPHTLPRSAPALFSHVMADNAPLYRAILDVIAASKRQFRLHLRAGELEDRMDLDFKYPRATPEKALLDWIYLGASARTKIAGPPFDIDADRLKKARLQRLSKAMSLQSQRKTYLENKQKYDEHPEVKANDSLDAGL
jgi:Protein of unknown function (DUF2397)